MRSRSTPAVSVVARDDDLGAVLSRAGVAADRPVLVVVGGAGGMSPTTAREVEELFVHTVLPVVRRCGGAVVDGGTDAGVMRAVGRAAARLDDPPTLLGVAAGGTVTSPGGPRVPGAADAEPHHAHLLLVPGDSWGDESAWIPRVAAAVARSAPSATLLAGGGEISVDDAVRSVDAQRPLLVLAGTGNAADMIARTSTGADDPTDARLGPLARSTLVRVVDVTEADEVRRAVEDALARDGQETV